MIEIIQLLLFSLISIFLHELGHYIVLKIFNIPIYSMGVSCQPVPHFYIRYKWPTSIIKHCAIILSGSLTTILGLSILLLFINYNMMKMLFAVYFFQLICETNPFFSDYVFAYVIYKNKIINSSPQSLNVYRSLINKYMFSFAWYIHFILWSILIILLIRLIDFKDILNI